MKFLLSIYGNDEKWASVAPDDPAAHRPHRRPQQGPGRRAASCSAPSGWPSRSTSRQVRIAPDGTRVVTDGPYIETKEYLGSFYVVDCDSLERALEIAAEMPSADLTEIEVRPLMHGGTADEL